MRNHVERVLPMLLRAVGLKSPAGAHARRTELQTALAGEQEQLRQLQIQLAERQEKLRRARARIGDEQTKLREAQEKLSALRSELSETRTVLASSSYPLVALEGADRNAAATIRALKAVETELRARLARAEHALEFERSRNSSTQGPAEGAPRQEERSGDDEPQDPWRERFALTVLRSADPRALSGRMPDRSMRSPPVMPHTGAAREAWRPGPGTTVSFVLTTHNRIGLLQLTVQSIRDQALPAEREIIAVDGGSSDGTIEWLARQEDIVSVIQHDRLAGKGDRRVMESSNAANLGFRLARGKWICSLDDCSLLLPGSLGKALRHLEALEAEGFYVGAGAFYFRDWPDAQRFLVHHTLGGMLMIDFGLFLKEALGDVGYAEEAPHGRHCLYADLALKLWDAGYKIVDCPESFLEHLRLPPDEPTAQDDGDLARDHDWLVERWNGRYASPGAPEMFKQPYQRFSDHRDAGHTARRFAAFSAGVSGRP